jgi:hypothetical protein
MPTILLQKKKGPQSAEEEEEQGGERQTKKLVWAGSGGPLPAKECGWGAQDS